MQRPYVFYNIGELLFNFSPDHIETPMILSNAIAASFGPLDS